MKIALIVNHIGISGLNNVVSDIATEFVQHGHSCTIICLTAGDNSKNSDNLDFHCDVKCVGAWTSNINLSDFDIIHYHGLWPMLNFLLHGKTNRQSKYLVTLHCYCLQDFIDLYGKLKGYLMSFLYLFAARKYDKIVCLSKDMMAYYKKWLPKDKLTDSYNTKVVEKKEELSVEEISELLAFKGDSVLIGMNGVLIYRKGIDIMIEALKLLPERFKLFIVGEGKEHDTFENMVKTSELEKRVYFAGSKRDAYRYLSYYDIFSMPSRSEGFSISLLEAAMYGKKVVCSDLQQVKECFNNGEVEMFKLPSPIDLAEAILRIEHNDEIGTRLKRRFEMDYSPERFYQRYLTIYNGIG